MQVSYATEPAPEGENEDRFRAGARWVLVLDGAGRYPGRAGGCVHPVTWVVERLATHAGDELDRRSDASLREIARQAITATMADHESTCDLGDPLSPGAALAIVRVGEFVEWLVLGDCAVAIDQHDSAPIVIVDDRVDHLDGAPVTEAAVRTYDPDFVAQVRNQDGGFWVAGARPEAADHALTGSCDRNGVRRILLCSDGVTRLTERHGWTWDAMFTRAQASGPASLIEAVREADSAVPDRRRWRGKPHDDATAALIQLVHRRGE